MQDRNHWIQVANERLVQARKGTRKLKNGKNKRLALKSNLIEQSIHLHIEDDLGLYIKAAHASLICGKWSQASEAFAKAASLYRHELKDTLTEAASLYCEAAWCEEKVELGGGREFFQKAISIYIEDERYDQAARIRKWIAQNEETNENYSEEIVEYERTSQYYKAAKMNQQVLICEQKVAFLLASVGKYEEASHAYYEIGTKELKYNLLKYGARHSFFRSCLLLLAREECDMNQVKKQIEDSMEIDSRFETTPECEFITNIVMFAEMKESHDFADHLYDFSDLYPFEELDLLLLNKVAKTYFSS